VASQAPVIESFQPILSVEDFHERVKVETVGKTGKKSSRRPNKKQVESLIAAGAFDRFGTRNEVMAEYYRCRKNKKEVAPEYTEEEWIDKEKEVLGLCLSQPPLYKKYIDTIKAKGWMLISDAVETDKKKVVVFGQVQSIEDKVSRKGSSMFLVHITDGLDTMKFYVFQGGKQFFKDNFNPNTIGGIPLSRFDDEGGMRFFDDRGECEPLETKKTLGQAPAKVKGKTNRRDLRTMSDGSVLMFTDGDTNEFYVSYDMSKTEKITEAHRLSGALPWLEFVWAMGDEYGADHVNKDLVGLYDPTTSAASDEVFSKILEMSKTYGEDALTVEIAYSWAYATMVAEENLKLSRLGKRVIRLAWHQVLIEKMSPGEASKWSEDREQEGLRKECHKYGF
jgi:hypothetical protein